MASAPTGGRESSLAAASGRPAPSSAGPSRLLLLPVDPPSQPAEVALDDEAAAIHDEPAIVLPSLPRSLRTPRQAPVLAAQAAVDPRDAVEHMPAAYPAPEPVAAPPEPEAIDRDPPWLDAEATALDAALIDAEPTLASPLSDEPAPLRRPARVAQPVTPAPPLQPPALDLTPEPADAGAEHHFGVLLRRAREKRGLSLGDVADKTRISPRWLQALEEAQLDILPAPVFVSGYLRSYARLLGLDGQALLERYQTLARKRAQALAPAERGFTVRRHGQPVQVPTWVIAALLSLLTAAVLAALWFTNTLWRR